MCIHLFICHWYAILGSKAVPRVGLYHIQTIWGFSTLPFWRLKSKEALFLTKQSVVRNKVSLRFITTRIVMRFRIISKFAICACVNTVQSGAKICMGHSELTSIRLTLKTFRALHEKVCMYVFLILIRFYSKHV